MEFTLQHGAGRVCNMTLILEKNSGLIAGVAYLGGSLAPIKKTHTFYCQLKDFLQRLQRLMQNNVVSHRAMNIVLKRFGHSKKGGRLP